MRCRQGGLLYGKEVDRVARFSLFEMCLKIYNVRFNGSGVLASFNNSVLPRQDIMFSSTLQTVALWEVVV